MTEYDPFDELPEMSEDLLLPAYLKDGAAAGRTYGELSYNRRNKSWTIKGEPVVCQMAKRLFPGCDGRGRGVARFTAHRRTVGDLNWLMLRYPLEIAERDREKWNTALQEARDYAIRREQARSMPERAVPPDENFSVARYQEMAEECIADIHRRGRRALLVGGTGLYLNALLYEMDFGPSRRDDAYRRELEAFADEEGNEALEERIDALGSLESAIQIAMEKLGLVFPDSIFFDPND